MRLSAASPAFVAVCVGLTCVLAAAPAPQQPALDSAFSAYSAGDHDAVARIFTHPNDFQRARILDASRLERWLGAWSPSKADFLIEMIYRASVMAPAYVGALVTGGQRYVISRPEAPGASASGDALERRWHVIALGVLQRRWMGENVLQYIDVLQTSRPLPASAPVWDARVYLARAIGQEQVCRAIHATARLDRMLTELEGAAATPPALRQMAIDCMQTAVRLLETAAAQDDVRDEARTRAGFAAFQLGRNADAKQALDAVTSSDDRTLAYWRALFRGRVADALGADQDAERAYREATTLFPDAQSAHIGLALALFRMHRDDDAEGAVRSARTVNPAGMDPWDAYFEGDGRFVAEWIAAMRKAQR